MVPIAMFPAALLALALSAAGPVLDQHVVVPPLNDVNAVHAAAVQAEKAGDLAKALQLYEDILDSGRLDLKTFSRNALYAKLAELKEKVPANTDPDKAGVWKVRAYVIRQTDVRFKDAKGADRHAIYRFTPQEIEGIRKGMQGFADLVWDYTQGNLRINWNLTVIDEPLTRWDGYPSPYAVMPLLKSFRRGEADSIFAYAKAAGAKGEESDKLDWICLAGTIGAIPETGLATWVGYNCGNGACTTPDGEVQLHEWLHCVGMALGWVQAYDDQGLVDWTSDGGSFSESWGIYQRPQGEQRWLPFYKHIMRSYVTRKMWRDLTITRPSNNPWLSSYVRDLLVCGPFEAGAKEPDAARLKPTYGAKEWKMAWTPGKFVSFSSALPGVKTGQVAYAAFVAHADQARTVQLRSQRDGSLRLWQNGELVFRSDAPHSWSDQPNVVDLQLKKGENLFILRLDNVVGDWAFSLKLTDMTGGLLQGVRLNIPRR